MKVCIFCGANSGNDFKIANATLLLCDHLIQTDCDLVYGGGVTGLMGLIADRFISAGRKVIGVRPEKLIADEAVHNGLTEVIVVKSMQERKALMVELSDAFIALPGGIGTLDEIVETFTLFKIGFTDKPSGILNVNGYYDGLIKQLERMVSSSFLKQEQKKMLAFSSNPKVLLENMQISKLDPQTKYIDKIAYIEIQDGKILTTRSFGKDKFYIPGGKRDIGETDEQTLLREIKEELDVRIDSDTIDYVGLFKAQAHGKSDDTQVMMTCYSAKYSGALKASNEIEEIMWLNFADKDLVSFVDILIFDYLKERGALS